METKEYNGWTNYETWNVKLWIDNEEGDYLYWRERARHWLKQKSTSPVWTKAQSGKFNLADELKDSFTDNAPELAGCYSDLLGAALSEVNWHEIADALLTDLD